MRRLAWCVPFLIIVLAVLCGPILLAQAASAVTGGNQAATGAQEASEWGSAGIWALFSTSALEWLKRKAWFTPLSDKTSWWAQRTIGIVMAFGMACGIHAAFVWEAKAGHLMIDVTGLLFPSIASAIGETLRQWALSEFVYRTAVKNYGKPGGN